LPHIIGLVARFWPQKRIKDALWAADQVKFAQLNFYLLILGDGPERENLLRYRDDLQIRDRVIMLGERSDVSRFMPCFDLLWNCSAYEGQSNSILEAQSFGIPVIASDVPGNRDLVETGKTGTLIPEFDGDETRRRTALSQETIRLLRPENKDLRLRLGQEAQKRVQENFSLQKAVERHTELYERLLSQK
jgi:glycosyltransferase involved in cell wall biosynthesis